MRKIIFVNRYFYPDISATSQMLSGIAFELAGCGHQIHVLTNRYRYDDASREMQSKELIDDVVVHRVWTSHFGRGNLFGRLIDYLSFYFSSFFCLFGLLAKGDVVVAKTDPPMISIICMFVCRVKRARMINWLQDLFPEVAKELGINIPDFIYKIIIGIRNISLRKADMNVVIGQLMSDRLSRLGIENEKITVIENWADERVIYPVKREDNSLREKWELENKFVIGYSGNLGRSHDFSGIVQAAESLREEQDIVFLFIGEGAQKRDLEKISKEKSLNMIFKPYQPMEILAESISLPDVHLITLKPELEGLIVPSKFYGIVAAHRPCVFIGDADGEIPAILKNYKLGLSSSNDADEIESAIRKLKDGLVCMENESYLQFNQKSSLKAKVQLWNELLTELA